MEDIGMNETIFDDVAMKLKAGFSYAQIEKYTGVETKYIKQIENYLKNKEVAKNERDGLL